MVHCGGNAEIYIRDCYSTVLRYDWRCVSGGYLYNTVHIFLDSIFLHILFIVFVCTYNPRQAARVPVHVPAAGSEPALPAVPEPGGRVPHGAGAAALPRDTEQRLHQAPRQPGAVHHGGQLQQGHPRQGQRARRVIQVLHGDSLGHRQVGKYFVFHRLRIVLRSRILLRRFRILQSEIIRTQINYKKFRDNKKMEHYHVVNHVTSQSE